MSRINLSTTFLYAFASLLGRELWQKELNNPHAPDDSQVIVRHGFSSALQNSSPGGLRPLL